MERWSGSEREHHRSDGQAPAFQAYLFALAAGLDGSGRHVALAQSAYIAGTALAPAVGTALGPPPPPDVTKMSTVA